MALSASAVRAAGAVVPKTKGLLTRLASPPARLDASEQRGRAVSLVKRFQAFARDSCGCEATSNRAHLRRAVFHATQDLDIEPFVAERLGGDVRAVESLARMECPVTVPDRTMMKVRVAESAPKRIIFAAKTLRRHLSLTETQTCRGCQKRSRCRFFKAPAEEAVEVGVKHIGRVLFGMAQYARAHLEQPEAYPLYFSPDNLASAETLLDALSGHLAEARGWSPVNEIDLADEETAKRSLQLLAKKKEQKKLAYLEEKAMSLPQWMRETLEPLPGPGMSKRQRALLGEAAEVAGTGAQRSVQATKDADPDEWVEEGAVPGEVASQIILDPAPPPAPRDSDPPPEDAEPIVIVDGIHEMPLPQRFQHHAPRRGEQADSRFSSVLGAHTATVVRRIGADGSSEAPRVDLDSVDLGDEALETELRGGYQIVDMLGSDALGSVPKEVLEYVSVSPGALDGVQGYHVGVRPREIDPSVLEELWARSTAGEKEMPFLTRVPFDTGPRKSGGSLPYQRLPHEQLLRRPEPELPPPLRAQVSSIGDDDAEDFNPADFGGSVKSSAIVELDDPLEEASEETLELDEHLAMRALADGDASRHVGSRSAGGGIPPLRPAEDVKWQGGPEAQDGAEDQRFVAWTSQPRPGRPVGVLEPQVDFGALSDPGRLDLIGVIDEEAAAPVRQGAPLPRGADFVSTFRRPLVPTPEELAADPLGAASPGVDVDAVKANVLQSALPSEAEAARTARIAQGGLEQDSQYIMGGDVKFPKLQPATATAKVHAGGPKPARVAQQRGDSLQSAAEKASATRRLPPRLGRLRQARLEDLSDLMRPGSGGVVARRARGAHATKSAFPSMRDPSMHEPRQKHSEPGADEDASASGSLGRPAQEEGVARDERNAAYAMQQLLHRRLKSNVRQKFPGQGGQGQRGGPETRQTR